MFNVISYPQLHVIVIIVVRKEEEKENNWFQLSWVLGRAGVWSSIQEKKKEKRNKLKEQK